MQLIRILFASVLVPLLVIGSASPAHAGLPGFRVLDLALDKAYFEELITDELKLTAEQRDAVMPIFEAYLANVKAIDADAHKAIEDAGAERRRRNEERYKWIAEHPGEIPPDDGFEYGTEEEIETDRRIFEAASACRRAGDKLLFEFLDNLQSHLTDDQQAAFEHVPDLIRLHSYFRLSVSANPSDLSIHPDLRTLLHDATREDGELAPWAPNRNALEEGDTEVQQHLWQLQQEYVEALASAINESMQQHRVAIAPPWVGKVIWMDDDSVEARQKFRDSGQRWSVIYDVNRTFADRVASVLHKAGHRDEREQWIRRFKSAYAPRLFADDVTDALHMWLQEREDATEAQLRALDERLAKHRLERGAIRFAGYELLVERKRHGWPSGYPLDDPRRYETEERLQANQNAMLTDFRALLTPKQDEVFEDFLDSCTTHHLSYDLPRLPEQHIKPPTRK